MQPEILVSKKPTGTVLLVDDDEGVRRVMTRWVADLGHQVLVAADAESALEIMQRAAVDVALCDVKMPGHDGIWLVEQLRRAYPATSIVMATGLTELDPMVTLRPGVVGYLVKPFHRAALEEVIQKGLEARHERTGGPPRPQPLLTDGRPSSPAPGAPGDARMGWSETIVEGVILARYPA
jgi:CheY-like chemotaxis protein